MMSNWDVRMRRYRNSDNSILNGIIVSGTDSLSHQFNSARQLHFTIETVTRMVHRITIVNRARGPNVISQFSQSTAKHKRREEGGRIVDHEHNVVDLGVRFDLRTTNSVGD